jgi:hypothetical protein
MNANKADAEPSFNNFEVVDFERKDQGVLLGVGRFGTTHNSLEKYQHEQSNWQDLKIRP